MDRTVIKDDWIKRAMQNPAKTVTQEDGRIRKWAQIEEAGNKWLRVVVLADGETVHNAFFDRTFKE